MHANHTPRAKAGAAADKVDGGAALLDLRQQRKWLGAPPPLYPRHNNSKKSIHALTRATLTAFCSSLTASAGIRATRAQIREIRGAASVCWLELLDTKFKCAMIKPSAYLGARVF
eukprot:scaffold101345_cov32-Tisochrysis_lutea.AAC.2